jgi:hypothetical protein
MTVETTTQTSSPSSARPETRLGDVQAWLFRAMRFAERSTHTPVGIPPSRGCSALGRCTAGCKATAVGISNPTDEELMLILSEIA